MQTREKHKCPPHHWRIDSDDVGVCCYCGEKKDFRKLQEKEGSFRAYVTYELAHPHAREESDERV